MWKYIKQYLHFAVLAALFMIGEVIMDLIQPGLMSKIVDDGVLGVSSGGVGDFHLIVTMGILMTVLVLIGGFCGSMNNVFVHLSGQNIGNEMRKDCFQNLLSFSFPQIDQFGAGSLVTRVKRLLAYSRRYPAICQQTDADPETGCMEFDIEKGRFSFRLTAPYSEERRRAASEAAKAAASNLTRSMV